MGRRRAGWWTQWAPGAVRPTAGDSATHSDRDHSDRRHKETASGGRDAPAAGNATDRTGNRPNQQAYILIRMLESLTSFLSKYSTLGATVKTSLGPSSPKPRRLRPSKLTPPPGAPINRVSRGAEQGYWEAY